MSAIDSAPPVRRPALVSAAAYLMFLVALVALVLAIIPLPYVSDVSDAAKRAYADAGVQNPDQSASFATLGLYVGAVEDFLAAVGFVILAIFNMKGSNVSRIITWIFAGLGVLCCGIGAVANQALSGVQTQQGVDVKEIMRKINDGYPSWYSGARIALTVVAIVALILVIILLALPAVNPFFLRGGGGGGGQVAEPPLPYPPVA